MLIKRFIGLAVSLAFVGACANIHASSLRSSNQKIDPNPIPQEAGKPQKVKSKFSEALKDLKPKEGNSGLILGFDTDMSENRKGYTQFYDVYKRNSQKIDANKTIYLTRINGQVKLAAKLNYIASPQKQGFIYAGQVRYLEKPRIEYCGCVKCLYSKCLIGFDYSRVWTTSSKQKIKAVQKDYINQIKNVIDSEFEKHGVNSQDVTSYEKISFIGNGFYITEGFWSKITGGAAWFNAYTKNSIVPLSPDNKITSRLRDLYTPQQIEQAFGERTVRKWLGGQVDVVEASTFTLARIEGRTHLFGLVEVDGNAHRSFHKRFDLGFASTMLVAYDNPSLDFEKFKSIYPNLIDFFVSPNQNIIFVLTKEEVIGIDVRMEKEIFKMNHNLLFNKIVMVEWATGDFVTDWEKELIN